MPERRTWPADRTELTEMLIAAGTTTLPGHMGLEVLEIEARRCRTRLQVGPHHLAPNGYLHAGAIITLADTAAGYGCIGNLPEGGTGFTTLEMKANFLGTLLEGSMLAEAQLTHGGRTTQVWDVTITEEATGRTLALFRCTQLVLYPPPNLHAMSDIYQSILRLRAIRDFEDEPLSPDHLERILEAARWTGSSKNRQDWSFVVVDDEDGLRALAEHGDFTQPIRDSAATIVLVQERGGNMFDIGRAAQNIMLAADAIGVASCPITLHRSDDAREHIGAPEGSVVHYAVALGYAAKDAEPRQYGGRKPAGEVVKRGSYQAAG